MKYRSTRHLLLAAAVSLAPTLAACAPPRQGGGPSDASDHAVPRDRPGPTAPPEASDEPTAPADPGGGRYDY